MDLLRLGLQLNQPPIEANVEPEAELGSINLKKQIIGKQSNMLKVLFIIHNLDSRATPSGVKNTSLEVFTATFSCTTSTNIVHTFPQLAILILLSGLYQAYFKIKILTHDLISINLFLFDFSSLL